MAKQKAHTLTIVRPATGLSERRADVDCLQPGTALFLLCMRHRVRNHDAAQTAAVERFDGVARQDPVCNDGHDLAGSVLHDGVGGLDQRAARVGHIVDNDSHAAANVTNKNHARDLVRPGPLLVDQGKAEVQAVGNRGGSRD